MLLWGCHLADVLPCMYNEAQVHRKSDLPPSSHPVGSNQFIHILKGYFILLFKNHGIGCMHGIQDLSSLGPGIELCRLQWKES